MPIIHFIPELEKEVTIEVIEATKISLDNSQSSIEEVKPRIQYQCPVYKTETRGATYVFNAQLKTKAPAQKWIIAGVAIILDVEGVSDAFAHGKEIGI